MDNPTTAPRLDPPKDLAAGKPPRFRVWIIVVLVLIVVGLVAGYLPRWKQRGILVADTRELSIPTVTVVSPMAGKASDGLTLPAEVKPFVESPIYARASGYLKRWLVDIGSKVEAGQLLAEIDTPEITQELAQGRAQLAQAEAALDLAKITASRWAELLKTASVSEQEAAEKKSDLALKAATVEAARANVRRLEEMQSFARVTAPFAGTITMRRMDVGELITAGSAREIFHLAQTDTLRVFVRVPQTSARGVSAGQTAELTFPEIPGRVFTAKVVRNSGVVSTDSRTLLVELALDNSKGEILAGGYAQVRMKDEHPDAALVLPSNTLLFHAEGPQVGVVRADGTVELRIVKLGRDFGPTIEIHSGISLGERVILNPADSLVNGATVRVAEPAKPVETK